MEWLPVLKSPKQSNYNWLIIFSEPNTPFNTVIWTLLSWTLLRIPIMARPLTALKSSHRSWFERILLSCDCAMHCGEEVMGVKLHCAICKGPKMCSLMSLSHTGSQHQSNEDLFHRYKMMWLQLMFYGGILCLSFIWGFCQGKYSYSTIAN